MKLMKINQEFKSDLRHLLPEKTYLLDNINQAEISRELEGYTVESPLVLKKFDASQDWNGKKILLHLVGGIGDLVHLTPIIRQLKKNWDCTVDLCCSLRCRDILADHPLINKIYTYPLSVEELEEHNHDFMVSFEDLITHASDKKKNSVDTFADHLGITVEDKKTDLYVNENHTFSLDLVKPKIKGKKRIVVQVAPSSPCRTYPYMADIVNILVNKYKFEVVLCVDPNFPIQKIENLPDTWATNEINGDLNTLKAIIASADGVIGHDSAIVHIGGAFNKPTVALYASFWREARVKYEPSIYAFQGTGACEPCSWSSRKSIFPQNKPCSQNPDVTKQRCVLFDSINPMRVCNKLVQLMNK